MELIQRTISKIHLIIGSKKLKDKIGLTENPEIFIWGVVTYVVHALQ